MWRVHCFTTFDFDGGHGSSSTVHLGLPVPVFATAQPAGALPIVSVSNVIVSAKAAVARSKSAELGRANLVRPDPIIDRGRGLSPAPHTPRATGIRRKADATDRRGRVTRLALRSIPKFERLALIVNKNLEHRSLTQPLSSGRGHPRRLSGRDAARVSTTATHRGERHCPTRPRRCCGTLTRLPDYLRESAQGP